MTSGEELLDASFAQFTDTIWFVDAPFAAAAAAATAWLTRLGGRRFFPIDEPLPELLGALEPWAMPSWKQILVATTSNWTAIFSQGSDIGSHDVLGRELGCRSLRTNSSPHIVRAGEVVNFGDTAFWLRDVDKSHRSIQASYQSRWEWHLDGPPLPFEDQRAYDAKRIVDRFDVSRMNSYCRALGIRRNDPDFYLPRGLLIEQDINGWPQHPRTLSGAEWRAANR